MDVSKKMWYPQIINFNRVFHCKPFILGCPYFWKHPFSFQKLKADILGVSLLLRAASCDCRSFPFLVQNVPVKSCSGKYRVVRVTQGAEIFRRGNLRLFEGYPSKFSMTCIKGYVTLFFGCSLNKRNKGDVGEMVT